MPRFPERLAQEAAAARCAVLGALLGLVLTPPMAAVWAYDPPDTDWASSRWVTRTFGPTLESSGALSFGRAEFGPYEVYGKGFFLVYLAMVPVVRVVHTRYVASGRNSKWEKWTWRMLWWGLLLAAAGDFATYWGVSVGGRAGQVLWSNGFGVEILANVFLLIPGTTLFAAGAVTRRQLPWWAGLLLLAWIPMCAVILVHVTAYVPNAVIVPLSLIWALVGVWLIAHDGGPSPALEPADQFA